MKIVLIAILVVANLISFLLMRRDKLLAKIPGARRIPEKTLLLSGAAFGGLGGVMGMRVFRHKTKHMQFQILMPAFLIVQAALVIWLFTII